MCATGADTIRNASFGLVSKAYDLVLVVGVEKMKDVGFGGLLGSPGAFHPVYGAQAVAVGRYAMAATRYFERYGISPEEGIFLVVFIRNATPETSLGLCAAIAGTSSRRRWSISRTTAPACCSTFARKEEVSGS